MADARRLPPRLLWISPGTGLDHDLVRRLNLAAQAGLRGFQLREKASFARHLVDFAPSLRAALAAPESLLLVNDRVDVCCAAGYDGVQLSHASISIRSARAQLGADAWIGASVHDERQLASAEDEGADFVIVSPVFLVRKRGMAPAPPLGLLGLRTLSRRSALPVLALGGIHGGNVLEVLDQGVHGVAVQSAVGSAADPRAVVADLLAKLGS